MRHPEDLLRSALDTAATAHEPDVGSAWSESQRRLAAVRRRRSVAAAVAVAAAAVSVSSTVALLLTAEDPVAPADPPRPRPTVEVTDPLHGVPQAEADRLARKCAADHKAGPHEVEQTPLDSAPADYRAVFAVPDAEDGAHHGTVVGARGPGEVSFLCFVDPRYPYASVDSFRYNWLTATVSGGVTRSGGGEFSGFGRYAAPVVRVTVTTPDGAEVDATVGAGFFWVDGPLDPTAVPDRFPVRGYDADGRVVYEQGVTRPAPCYRVDGRTFDQAGTPDDDVSGRCAAPYRWPS